MSCEARGWHHPQPRRPGVYLEPHHLPAQAEMPHPWPASERLGLGLGFYADWSRGGARLKEVS